MELVARKIAVYTNLSLYDNFAKVLLYTTSVDGWNKKTSICRYSTRDAFSLRKCYKILDIPDGSDQEAVREAFVKLVKIYHPDSGSPKADATKFQEIDTAYHTLLDKFSKDRWNHNECEGEYGLYHVNKNEAVKEQDIEHTAPQHRQYLSYGGFGSGTPSQRLRQYQTMRAETAVNNLHNYRVNKVKAATPFTEEQALVVKDKKEARKIKTGIGFDRLVEDLIQESMAKGEFDNLAGQGKPLSKKFDHHNPYVDLVTQKLNQVLIENGFKPEWITLQNEIRDEKDDIIQKLIKVRKSLGPEPFNEEDQLIWQDSVLKCTDSVKKLNSKISKYNLLVPLLRKQMIQFDLKKEAEKIFNEVKSEMSSMEVKRSETDKLDFKKKEETSFLSSIFSLF